MLSHDEKLTIMEQAFEEGYQGFISDLFAQADPQEAMGMNQPPIPESNPNEMGVSPSSNVPTVSPVSNMTNMVSPQTQEIPNSQSLIKSYETLDPGELPRGENITSTLDTASEYKTGGARKNLFTRNIKKNIRKKGGHCPHCLKNMLNLDLDLMDLNPRTYIKNYEKQKGGPNEEFAGLEHTQDKGISANVQPIEFSEYYYKSPKHKERMKRSGYSNKEIRERFRNFRGVGPTIENVSPGVGSWAYPDANIVRMDATNPNYNEVLSHELSHLSSQHGLNKKDEQEIMQRNKIVQSGAKWNPTRKSLEVKADLDAIRYMLFNADVYDAGKEDFDSYDLIKAKDLLKDSKTFNRLLKEYTDDDVMWMLNNIAMESPAEDSPNNLTTNV